jgi:hypothetical protein
LAGEDRGRSNAKSAYGAVDDDPKYGFTGVAEQLLLASEGVSIPNAKPLVME